MYKLINNQIVAAEDGIYPFQTMKHTLIQRGSWIIDRHRNQKDFGIATTHTDAQIQSLAEWMQTIRDMSEVDTLTNAPVPIF